MGLTNDRHQGPEYLQQAIFEDPGIGDPPAAAQLLYSNGNFRAYDQLGVFNLRRPWSDILDGSANDVAGTTIYKTATYTGVLPSVVTYFSDSAKTKRIASRTYVYGGTVPVIPSQIICRIYAADGTSVRQTATDTITVGANLLETGRTRAFS